MGARDDIVMADLAGELADMEIRYVEALADGASYRHAYLAAIDQLHVTQDKLLNAERRLAQVMGLRTWHIEEDAE